MENAPSITKTLEGFIVDAINKIKHPEIFCKKPSEYELFCVFGDLHRETWNKLGKIGVNSNRL